MSKIYKYLSVTLLVVGAVLCMRPSKYSPHTYQQVEIANGCLVDSVVFVQTLEANRRLWEADIWTVIVTFIYESKDGTKKGHAVVVYEFNGRFYVYDPMYGSHQLLGINPKEQSPILVIPEVFPPDGKLLLKVEVLTRK